MIVERDEILTAIRDQLAEAGSGTGSLVLLAGEAGTGKSSVVRTVVADAGPSTLVVEGACDPLTTARPLGPYLEITSHSELHLGHLDPTAVAPPELFAALVDELAGRPGPTLVVVEDLHWADEGTLDMVRFLGRRIERTRAVVLVTYRSNEVTGGHPLEPVLGQLLPMSSTTQFDVAALSANAIGTLAANAGVDIDPDVVHRRTGGNAFFVAEVLASAGGRPAGRHNTDRSIVEVPTTVQAAVVARVGALSAGSRQLVEAVAVSPRALEFDYAAALVDEAVMVTAVDEAVAAGVLSMNRGCLEFRHELARLAVDGSMPSGRRRRHHRRLLDRLIADGNGDVSRLAHHAIEVGDDELVIRYGLEAADTASARGSNREARDYLRQVLRYAGRVEPDVATAWRLRLGSLLAQLGDAAAAIAVATEAEVDARQRGDHGARSTALQLLSRAHRDTGQTTRAHELAQQAIAVAEAAPEAGAVHAQALTNAAFLAMLRRRSRSAVELAEHANERAVAAGDRAAAADAQHALACANLIAGREDEAIEHLVRLEHEAAVAGATVSRVRLAVNIGSGCGEIRRYDVASHWLDVAHRLSVDFDFDRTAVYSLAWKARVAFETGRWDDVGGAVDEATGAGTNGPARFESYARVTALGALGRTRIRRGDPGGEPILVEAMELGADHDVQYLWPVACGLAEFWLWRGEPERGLEWLRPVHDKALETDSVWARGETAFWMWRLGAIEDPPEPAAEPFRLAISGQWRAAARQWREIGCPYEQALALLDGGNADPLMEAVSILDSLGARPAAQFGRRKLRDLGHGTVPAMPRTSTASNPASLTNRQREVLELLVEGASNQDIADRLFVSKKTVEHHVSAVYDKLGVRDRPAAMIAGRTLLSPNR